jgi:hypothetical protein
LDIGTFVPTAFGTIFLFNKDLLPKTAKTLSNVVVEQIRKIDKLSKSRFRDLNSPSARMPWMAQQQVDRLTRFEQLLVSPDEGCSNPEIYLYSICPFF